MIRTKRGLSLMDKLGAKTITKPLAWFMLYLMPVAGAVALFFIAQIVAVYFFSPQGAAYASYVRTISPLANLLLPGINPYLPLSVWVAVIIAVVIHEASHGIVARSLGLPVKSAGVLLLLFIPIGAFVEVDDRLLKDARSRDSLRVLAAGSGINFILGAVSLILLVLLVGSMVPAAPGVAITGVQQNQPAYQAGIRPGDVITAANGHPVGEIGTVTSIEGQAVSHMNSSFTPGEIINITVWRGGQTLTIQGVKLGQITYQDTKTNQNFTYAFLGVDTIDSNGLRGVTYTYANAYKQNPLLYLAWIPTFPRFESSIPFSDYLSAFYTSPLGPLTTVAASTLYWLFFVNFNLAIFNSLPIYPMDGGQAFESFLRGVGRGKISEELARRVTTGVTLTIFLALFLVIAGPYITGAFSPALG